jgi:hypothetical protein
MRMAGRNDWENGWQAANDLHIATSSRLIDCIDSLLKQPTVYLMNIADLRRSSACSRSNCRRFAHITAQREAFLGSSPARASTTARAASSRWLVDARFVGSRCFSAPLSRSASLPRHLRSCCSSAPPPPHAAAAAPPRPLPCLRTPPAPSLPSQISVARCAHICAR